MKKKRTGKDIKHSILPCMMQDNMPEEKKNKKSQLYTDV